MESWRTELIAENQARHCRSLMLVSDTSKPQIVPTTLGVTLWPCRFSTRQGRGVEPMFPAGSRCCFKRDFGRTRTRLDRKIDLRH